MASTRRLQKAKSDKHLSDTARTLVLVADSDVRAGPGSGSGIGRPLRPVGCRLRVWHRALARFLGPFQDDALAAGRSPDGDPLRAVRARALVAPANRERLARDWENLLRATRARPVLIDARAPLCRRRILAAESDISELISALRSQLPVPVRGVAMAMTLLTDGIGPVYNRASTTDLTAAVRAAIDHMDPWTSLMGPDSSAPSAADQGSPSLR